MQLLTLILQDNNIPMSIYSRPRKTMNWPNWNTRPIWQTVEHFHSLIGGRVFMDRGLEVLVVQTEEAVQTRMVFKRRTTYMLMKEVICRFIIGGRA